MLSRLWTIFVCTVGMCFGTACPNDPPDETGEVDQGFERTTRFDDMKEGPPLRRVPRRSVNAAVVKSQREVHSKMDKSVMLATAEVLAEEPQTMVQAKSLGKLVGMVQRSGTEITLRLDDEKGPVFARFQAPRLEVQPCWSALWQPEWLPVPAAGTGMGIEAESQLTWWRFDSGDEFPFLVRFGPDGIAIWRPNLKDNCYRGESLLGLVGGGLSTEEYLSPVAPTDGASPDETEETDGTKPLRIDILPPRGKEEITARRGVVELRTARKKRLMKWKTSLRGGAACTQAAYHRFLGDPVKIYFEIEFSDEDSCDEGWGKREVQQTLFELRDGEMVPIVSGSMSAGSNENGEVTRGVDLDVRVPSGDGRLRYVGNGQTTQGEIGGGDEFDCGPWASDQGYDAADTGFSHARYEGRWTFELEDQVVEIGPVLAVAKTYQCNEAAPD